MGFEPGTLPLTRDRVCTACAKLFTLCQAISFCVGMSFPVSGSVFLCSDQLYHPMTLRHNPSFQYFRSTGEKEVLLLQHQRGACRPSGLHQLLGTSASHKGPVHTIETDLALSLLDVSKNIVPSGVRL